MRSLKIKCTVISIAIVLGSATAFAVKNKRLRKPANSSYPYESVILEYTSSETKLAKLRFHLAPFNKYIALRFPFADPSSESGTTYKTVVLDCGANAQNTQLNCVSGCDGGDLVVEFSRGVRLDSLKVKSFENFKPLACDGSETGDVASYSVSNDIVFTLKKMSLEK